MRFVFETENFFRSVPFHVLLIFCNMDVRNQKGYLFTFFGTMRVSKFSLLSDIEFSLYIFTDIFFETIQLFFITQVNCISLNRRRRLEILRFSQICDAISEVICFHRAGGVGSKIIAPICLSTLYPNFDAITQINCVLLRRRPRFGKSAPIWPSTLYPNFQSVFRARKAPFGCFETFMRVFP